MRGCICSEGAHRARFKDEGREGGRRNTRIGASDSVLLLLRNAIPEKLSSTLPHPRNRLSEKSRDPAETDGWWSCRRNRNRIKWTRREADQVYFLMSSLIVWYVPSPPPAAHLERESIAIDIPPRGGRRVGGGGGCYQPARRECRTPRWLSGREAPRETASSKTYLGK